MIVAVTIHHCSNEIKAKQYYFLEFKDERFSSFANKSLRILPAQTTSTFTSRLPDVLDFYIKYTGSTWFNQLNML